MLVLLPNRLQHFIHKHLEGRVLCIRKAVFEREHASRMIICTYISPLLLMIHLRKPSWKYIMHIVCHSMWHVSYHLLLLPTYIHMHKPKHVLLFGNHGRFIVEVVQECFIHAQTQFVCCVVTLSILLHAWSFQYFGSLTYLGLYLHKFWYQYWHHRIRIRNGM